MIKVTGLAWVRFSAPDLEKMENCLLAFGLHRRAFQNDTLYMRSAGSAGYVHVTELGESKFQGLAYTAASEQDLQELSNSADAISGVENIDGPGGGKRVRLRDPDGYQVEVVHGISDVEVLPPPETRGPVNFVDQAPRIAEPVRLSHRPTYVQRIGHAGMLTTNVPAMVEFYQRNFGLLVSDYVNEPESGQKQVAFMRCDRGKELVDHHVTFFLDVGENGFDHASFQVDGIDEIMVGQEHMKASGYEHHWGLGRHFLGSQIFDYWFDPYGNIIEHYTDGDVFDASKSPDKTTMDVVSGVQWGMRHPQMG